MLAAVEVLVGLERVQDLPFLLARPTQLLLALAVRAVLVALLTLVLLVGIQYLAP